MGWGKRGDEASVLLDKTSPHMLFVVVSGEVPDVDGAALVRHNQCGLVGMEAHASDWRIHLEQPLALLRATPGGGQGGGKERERRDTTHNTLSTLTTAGGGREGEGEGEGEGEERGERRGRGGGGGRGRGGGGGGGGRGRKGGRGRGRRENNQHSPHSEVPYPGSVVLPTRVHELPVFIETDGRHVLRDSFKHVHLWGKNEPRENGRKTCLYIALKECPVPPQSGQNRQLEYHSITLFNSAVY